MTFLLVSAAVLLGFVNACGGNDDTNANQISPIKAGVSFPSQPGYNPVVWLDPVGVSDDLVTLDVKLRASSPLEFFGFTLYFRFDPTLVQFAGAMQPVDPTDPDGRIVDPFGECGSLATYCSKYPLDGTCGDINSGTCMITEAGICATGTGLCLNSGALNQPCTIDADCDRGECDSGLDIGKACAADADCDVVVCATGSVVGSRCLSDADCEPATSGPSSCQIASTMPGEVPLALSGNINGKCDSYIMPAGVTDVVLLRVAFSVTSVTPGTRLELVSYDQTGMSGDCAILDDMLNPLAIPCDDGGALLTGTR